MNERLPSWDGLLGYVRGEYAPLWRSWFEQLPAADFDRGELRIEANDPAQARYLRERCLDAFRAAAMAQTGRLVAVRVLCRSEPLRSAGTGAGLTQLPLSPDYTFDQFVVGPSNRMAVAACRAVISQPGTLYNPLFVHGDSGLGKSHLLQATCAAIEAAAGGRRVTYVSCETFVNDFVRAIESGGLRGFREDARESAALVIDDMQFLADRESSQEEFFHTFNALFQARRQIILSADAAPNDIPSLEDRLVSRFNWGLVTRVDPPDRETRVAILQKKARLRGWDIPDTLLDFIAEHVASNIRVLEGALNKLMSEIQIGGKPMTIETAKLAIDGFKELLPKPVTANDIMEVVCQYFGVKLPDLVGRRRTRAISYPRQVGMYLCRELTPLSLEEVGGHFGGRDHTTVLHAEKVIQGEVQAEKTTAQLVEELRRRLVEKRARD